MQLMSWMFARLGSRFTLLFDPHLRRARHSALGRFLDAPIDLMVGLVEPDGEQRVLPFTKHGKVLYNPEQFERLNSITYRGYSERYRLRFEFNVHSVFYPQHEAMCTMPAFYLEMRLNPAPRVRWTQPAGPTPPLVRLFIRINRPDTDIAAACEGGAGQIDMSYRVPLEPRLDDDDGPIDGQVPHAAVQERIVSLNTGCSPDESGRGLSLELPVTEVGSGVKWRLVWGAHCAEPILNFSDADCQTNTGRLRYAGRLANLDSVMDEAIGQRDVYLAHSRRFEKLFDEASLSTAQRHLINQSFQTFLANTFWCDLATGDSEPESSVSWFSVWEGSCQFHSTMDVEYNVSLFYLSLWPQLLALQLDQWPKFENRHEPSGGSFLSHDLGRGLSVSGQCYPHDMPVEVNANYLLLLQVHAHWMGDLSIAERHSDLIERLSSYLLWTDTDDSGFPSEGTANFIDDGSPAIQFSRKQTYLAIKRLAALQAAAGLLRRVGREQAARHIESVYERDASRIDARAWLTDHYAVCVDRSAVGIVDVWNGERLPFEDMQGWDAYSIHTANALLLPAMIGQPLLLDHQRLAADYLNATRETLGRYGCGHSSLEPDSVWISQNMWREQIARYLGVSSPGLDQLYWDMQVMSNTDDQSLAYVDTYITNNLSFYPRGITSIGYLLAGPRLVIDRLAPGGSRITVEPDIQYPQRWPLLPLADWPAGKIPTCVVRHNGTVTIEGESDPVIIRGQMAEEQEMIG